MYKPVELSFAVTADMAEKPFEIPKGANPKTSVMAINHNGRILSERVSALLFLDALNHFKNGHSPNLGHAITCTHVAFWNEWKAVARHFQGVK